MGIDDTREKDERCMISVGRARRKIRSGQDRMEDGGNLPSVKGNDNGSRSKSTFDNNSRRGKNGDWQIC